MNANGDGEGESVSFLFDGILKIALGFDQCCRLVVGCHNKCENEMFNKIIILSFSRTMCVIQWQNVFVSSNFIFCIEFNFYGVV